MSSPDHLPEPIRRLIKPRLALYDETHRTEGVLTGFWGGEGAVPLPDTLPQRADNEPPKHWLSVDCAWLDRNSFGIRGCLSLYELASCEFAVVHDPVANLVAHGGEPLFGVEEQSLPDYEAVEAYLNEVEFEEIRQEWEGGLAQQARENCPIYRPDLVAVLGADGTSVGPKGRPSCLSWQGSINVVSKPAGRVASRRRKRTPSSRTDWPSGLSATPNRGPRYCWDQQANSTLSGT